jgi:hypothetical protein
LTVATLTFEEAHVACVVTPCVVLFDSTAVAVNCDVAPTVGASPLTLTVVTVGVDGVGVPTSTDVKGVARSQLTVASAKHPACIKAGQKRRVIPV